MWFRLVSSKELLLQVEYVIDILSDQHGLEEQAVEGSRMGFTGEYLLSYMQDRSGSCKIYLFHKKTGLYRILQFSS